MFIDCHAHAYRLPTPGVVAFCTLDQVLQRYDAADIEKGALLPLVNPEIYMPQTNEDILEMASRHPDRIFPFCNIDPRALTNSSDAPLDQLLRHYKDQGCKGVGEIMPNIPMRDPMVQNLFKHAQNVGLPVTFDGSDQVGGDFGLYDDPGLPQLEHSLQRFPNLVMIAHGPVFWTEIAPLVTPAERKPPFFPDGGQTPWVRPTGPIEREGVVPTLFRRYANLYGELSDAAGPLARDPVYGARLLTEFQDRLLFGTDLCGFETPFRTRDLLLEWRDTGRISSDVFAKIARENAVKLFGLEG